MNCFAQRSMLKDQWDLFTGLAHTTQAGPCSSEAERQSWQKYRLDFQ